MDKVNNHKQIYTGHEDNKSCKVFFKSFSTSPWIICIAVKNQANGTTETNFSSKNLAWRLVRESKQDPNKQQKIWSPGHSVCPITQKGGEGVLADNSLTFKETTK